MYASQSTGHLAVNDDLTADLSKTWFSGFIPKITTTPGAVCWSRNWRFDSSLYVNVPLGKTLNPKLTSLSHVGVFVQQRSN